MAASNQNILQRDNNSRLGWDVTAISERLETDAITSTRTQTASWTSSRGIFHLRGITDALKTNHSAKEESVSSLFKISIENESFFFLSVFLFVFVPRLVGRRGLTSRQLENGSPCRRGVREERKSAKIKPRLCHWQAERKRERVRETKKETLVQIRIKLEISSWLAREA